MRIVFMGTPDFAVESLKVLVENNYEVVGVITMPDKPAGRGHKLQFSPVKQYALEHNLPVLQPEKLKDEVFLEKLKNLHADLQVVVAFRMLPEVVWDMPRYGTFNLHASLLPQYRGAAPINWAIINGEKETGATTFFLTHEIDTGKIILQEKIPVAQTDNAGIVHDKLMVMGADMVRKTVDLLMGGKTNGVDQAQFIHSGLELKPAPKIFKDDCQIDWSKSTNDIYNFIRGISPKPCAWTYFYSIGKAPLSVKVSSVEKLTDDIKHKNRGKIKISNENELLVFVNKGLIRILELQFPGKKNIKAKDFLNGYTFKETDSFEMQNQYIDYVILKALLSTKGKLQETIMKESLKYLLINKLDILREQRIKSKIKKRFTSIVKEKKYISEKVNLRGRKKSSFVITTQGLDYYRRITK